MFASMSGGEMNRRRNYPKLGFTEIRKSLVTESAGRQWFAGNVLVDYRHNGGSSRPDCRQWFDYGVKPVHT
ncbi:hypothetical protein E4U55_002850, partial [Claviceps digitariae]